MKKLLIPAMLLAAASSYGALTNATGDQQSDYDTWFSKFYVESNVYYPGQPSVVTDTPAAYNDSTGVWSGWEANFGSTALSSTITNPFANTSELYSMTIEIVFLGETAGWLDHLGYTLNGVDYYLATNMQAVGVGNVDYGDYATITLLPGESIDLFVIGNGTAGGKYYVYDTSKNVPSTATMQSYYGTLAPKDSLVDPENLTPFYVVGFEDIRLDKHADGDYNDVIIAFRSYYDIPQGPVPEPSTYGLIGAATLLGFAGYRRFRKRA